MANIDNIINVNISLASPSVASAGFGVPLFLGLATFAPDLKYYSSFAEVSADSSQITGAQLEAARVAFASSNPPTRIALGKLASFTAPTAQVDTVSVGGNDAGDYTITITNAYDGIERSVTYVANGVEAAADIAAGLATLVEALPGVSAAATLADVAITQDFAGYALTTAVTNADANLSVATSTPNATGVVGALDTFLDAIVGAGQSFYGIAIDSRDDDIIEAVADWSEANEFLFSAQTSSADLAAGTLPNIGSALKGKSLSRTFLTYYTDNAERADAAWLAGKLSADPDEVSTVWAQFTLVGIPTESLSSTVQANVRAQNASFYTTLYGVGATYPGTLADGNFIDLRITADWLKARIEEDSAQILLDASNRNEKIPYTDDGIGTFANVVRQRLTQGERVGHLIPGTSTIDVPSLVQIPPATRRSRVLTLSFESEPAGAIQEATINGTVAIPL